MKLCQKCVDATAEASGLKVGQSLGEIAKKPAFVNEDADEHCQWWAEYELVPESDCEFWAHIEARKLYTALVVATKA